jgi:hypothetical protein
MLLAAVLNANAEMGDIKASKSSASQQVFKIFVSHG